jgi:archaemetzincin
MSWLALVPFGALPGPLLSSTASTLSRTLEVEVRLLPTLAEPEHAYSAVREQWLAPEYVKTLLAQCPPEPSWLLGLTEHDLFVPVLSFVFGQAQLRGRAAVVSLARLRPEFLGLPPDPELLAVRLAKEAVHETGHLFGLVHCPDRQCPMSLSIGLEELDLKTARPCASCAGLLAGSFDVPRTRPVPTSPPGGRS